MRALFIVCVALAHISSFGCFMAYVTGNGNRHFLRWSALVLCLAIAGIFFAAANR